MRKIKIIAPFGDAMDATFRRLYRPFSLARYVRLAFIAWLAMLGTNGFFSLFANMSSGSDPAVFERYFEAVFCCIPPDAPAETRFSSPDSDGKAPSIEQGQGTRSLWGDLMRLPAKGENLFRMFSAFYNGMSRTVQWLFAPIAVAAVVVTLWLYCRFRCVLIAVLARRDKKVELISTWRATAPAAKEFFRFSVCYFLVLLLLFLLINPGLLFILDPPPSLFVPIRHIVHIAMPQSLFLILSLLILIPGTILYFLYAEFGPILILKTSCSGKEAFKRVLGLWIERPWALIKFLIFTALFHVVASCIIVLICAVTCCLYCIFWFFVKYLPFLATLVFLPFLLLRMNFTIYFARQIDEDFSLVEADQILF